MATTVKKNPYTEPKSIIKLKSTGNGVKWVQWNLKQLGYYSGSVDGQFGSGTSSGVKKFQKAKNIQQDGVVGQVTRAALKDAIDRKFNTKTTTTAKTTTTSTTKTIGSKGLELIKYFEGCYLKAYKCPAGVWTIGYGHIEGVKSGMTITKKEAEDILKKDMVRYAESTDKTCKAAGLTNLTTNERDALISFCYNCGAGNLKKLITGRNKKQIADAMLNYTKGGGKVLPGLVKRRKKERELFLSK